MYYFKTKHKVRKGASGYVDVWKFTGIISPERSDCIVMSTTKCTDAIYHTDRDVELVKHRLTDKGYKWRVYNAVTDECLNVEDIDGQIVEHLNFRLTCI